MALFATEFSTTQKAGYLKSLPSIRERSSKVHALALENRLQYFEYHPENEEKAAEFCVEIIKRDFGTAYESIPPHGRWRHLDAGRDRIDPLIKEWASSASPPDTKETCKRLIDLFLTSVLLDAGAGNTWKYKEEASGKGFTRSEGLGVASFDMFVAGMFSSDPNQLYQVDAEGLAKLTTERISAAMQVTASNPMVGIAGRASLLLNLSTALKANAPYFGANGRPGNVLDFLEAESAAGKVHISSLWAALIEGLSSIWPSRHSLAGVPLGDVWPCGALAAANPTTAGEGDDFVPFHKLTGWLTYSLIEPIEKVLGWKFEGLEDMTGLPEYRNGGLLVDTGVLSLKPGAIPASFFPDAASPIPQLPPSHPAIIEWRAMTVIELDRIADLIRKKTGYNLTLAQVLESATWKGGRELAKQKRPATSGPPIEILSDGTVF